jgi:hypothetical protein
MNTKKTSSVVDDYLNALLLDTQISVEETSSREPVLRFARVERGFELVTFWCGALNVPQQLCRDLTLLSMCRSIPGQRLKKAMLNATTFIGH